MESLTDGKVAYLISKVLPHNTAPLKAILSLCDPQGEVHVNTIGCGQYKPYIRLYVHTKIFSYDCTLRFTTVKCHCILSNDINLTLNKPDVYLQKLYGLLNKCSTAGYKLNYAFTGPIKTYLQNKTAKLNELTGYIACKQVMLCQK